MGIIKSISKNQESIIDLNCKKTIDLDSEKDKTIMDFLYKVSCVDKKRKLTSKEFKNSQVQTNFKEIIELVFECKKNNDFNDLNSVLTYIESTYNDLNDKDNEIVESLEKDTITTKTTTKQDKKDKTNLSKKISFSKKKKETK